MTEATLTPLLGEGWLQAILPEVILTLLGLALILLEVMAGRLRPLFAPITVAGLIAAAYAQFLLPAGTFFGGTYQISLATTLFDLTFLLAALLAVMFSRDYLRRERIESGEYYALLAWGTVGLMMMAKGLDLLIVILGLETLSICIFVLLGFHRRMPVSNESSLKYFLMGAFATGFILYGTALIYGATGSTRIPEIGAVMASPSPNPALLTVAFVMLIGGLGFKLALAPFHAWAPDVYQGAPSPIAAWLSVAPKAATLVALIRLLAAVLPTAESLEWLRLLAVLSVLSMVLGNFVAIAQRDLKRMLAYSGIAHVGYMMIAVRAVNEESVAALVVYAFTYALMNIGAFGVISLLDKNQNDPQTLDDVAGLGFRRPFVGLALAICMFSLAGLPPTAGFIAKIYVFKVAIEAGDLWLALIGILTSIVSVYYYLRVVYYLYMKTADEATPLPAYGAFSMGALAISIIGILVLGIYPTPIFDLFPQAAQSLFPGP